MRSASRASRSARATTSSYVQVEDVLLEWIDRAATGVPVDLLPDEQVLALRDQQAKQAPQAEAGEVVAQQGQDRREQNRRRNDSPREFQVSEATVVAPWLTENMTAQCPPVIPSIQS